MQLQLEKTEYISSDKGTEFTLNMGREQVALFTKLLVTANYKNPLKASIREILNNAIDATVEAHPNNPPAVEIEIKHDRVIIGDYGNGLSQEQLENLYTVIGASTKRESNNLIGAFGIGRLAPLALNNHFIVESFHNGTHTVNCVFLNDEGIPSISVWEVNQTTRANGLTVHILLPGQFTSNSIAEAAVSGLIQGTRHNIICKNFKHLNLEDALFSVTTDSYTVDYYPNLAAAAPLKISGYECRVTLDLGGSLYPLQTSGANIVVSDSNPEIRSTHTYTVLFSNIPTNTGRLPAGTAIIRVPPNYVPVTGSREGLVDSEDTQQKLQELINVVIPELGKQSELYIQDKLEELKKEHDGLSIFKNILYYYDNLKTLFISNCLFNIELQRSNGDKVLLKHQQLNKETGLDCFSLVDANTNKETRLNRWPLYDKRSSLDFRLIFYGEYKPSELYEYTKRYCKEGGKNTHRFNKLSGVELSILMHQNFQIILTDNDTTVSRSSLRKQYPNIDLELPILLVSLRYYGYISLEYLDSLLKSFDPIINYLGVYTHISSIKSPKVKKEGTTNKVNLTAGENTKEVNLLIRQIKSLQELQCKGQINNRERIDIYAFQENLTEEDLTTRRFFYVTQDQHNYETYSVIGHSKVLSELSDYFPKNILHDVEPVVLRLTENAHTRIKELKQKGMGISWLSWSEAEDFVKYRLLDILQNRLHLLEKIDLCLIRCIADFGYEHLIPKPTLSLVSYEDSEARSIYTLFTSKWLINKEVDLTVSNPYSDKEHYLDQQKQIYADYEGEYITPESLYGPWVSPLVPALRNAMKFLSIAYSSKTDKAKDVVEPVLKLASDRYKNQTFLK